MSAVVVFYISGHGFGHASRQIEIINALGASAPDLRIVVRTSAARWLFDRTVGVPIAFTAAECDTGIVQIDSLRLDEQATIARASDFHRMLDRRAQAEAEFLRAVGARLVVSDAPPLACAAAAAAGVPSVVVSNFTWDWIYLGYREPLDAAPALLSAIQSAYSQAREAWRLPMHGGFGTIASIRDVPFVARHARHDPEAVRRRLGLPVFRPLLLSSFGGYGLSALDVAVLDCLDEYGLVLTEGIERDGSGGPRGRGTGTLPRNPEGACPPGVYRIDESSLYDNGFRYEDLVAAVDVVVTKPGYGIIAECIANGTAILYTSRGRFAEYDVLVAEMPRYLRCAFIDHGALFSGRWRAALDRLEAAPQPPERPPTDGAEVIAGLIRAEVAP